MGTLLGQPRDARRADRVQFDVAQVRLRQQGALSIVVTVKDLSRTGFRAEWPHNAKMEQVFWLRLPNLAPLMARVVWSKNFEIGCRFGLPLHNAVFEWLVTKYASGRAAGVDQTGI